MQEFFIMLQAIVLYSATVVPSVPTLVVDSLVLSEHRAANVKRWKCEN